MVKVYFRGGRREARELVRRMQGMLVGREADVLGVARGVFLTLGFSALNSIKQDFIAKSRGGAGIDGVKWAPLSKKYLAYQRRFGNSEKASLKKAAGLGKQHRFGVGGPAGGNAGLLTKDQQKTWKKIFGSRLARFLVSMPPDEAKARAAKIAWATIKRQGAKTMLEVYGNRQVEILRDTGVLFNSLSPGQLDNPGPNAVYTPPSGDGGDQQIFRTMANGVIVGTTVPYASAHQEGKKVPARPFLPTGEVPEQWEREWLEAGVKALEVGARMLFEAA